MNVFISSICYPWVHFLSFGLVFCFWETYLACSIGVARCCDLFWSLILRNEVIRSGRCHNDAIRSMGVVFDKMKLIFRSLLERWWCYWSAVLVVNLLLILPIVFTLRIVSPTTLAAWSGRSKWIWWMYTRTGGILTSSGLRVS